jgi:hypothetical protein
MPTILSQDESPGSAGAVSSAIMAFAEMGHLHCRNADSSARQLYLRDNRSGVFHKMDRGKAAHKHKLCNNQKVLLEEHSLSIWGTQTHNSGQRNIQGILSVDWHEGCLRISVSPTVDQSSQESKLFDLSGNEKILEGEKKGKWAEVMPMVVWSHNTTIYQATNFTLFRLMYGMEAMLLEEIKHRSLRATVENIV